MNCTIHSPFSQFSPWTPDIKENGILDTCRELGISIVAYSPLGRGKLKSVAVVLYF